MRPASGRPKLLVPDASGLGDDAPPSPSRRSTRGTTPRGNMTPRAAPGSEPPPRAGVKRPSSGGTGIKRPSSGGSALSIALPAASGLGDDAPASPSKRARGGLLSARGPGLSGSSVFSPGAAPSPLGTGSTGLTPSMEGLAARTPNMFSARPSTVFTDPSLAGSKARPSVASPLRRSSRLSVESTAWASDSSKDLLRLSFGKPAVQTAEGPMAWDSSTPRTSSPLLRSPTDAAPAPLPGGPSPDLPQSPEESPEEAVRRSPRLAGPCLPEWEHGLVSRGVVRTEASKRKLRNLPYSMQGDETMYTEEKVQARKQLQHAREVQAVLDQWWRSMPKSALRGEAMTKENYVSMFILIMKALDADFTHAAAQETAEADWAEDSAGQAVMSKGRLQAALFQLADLWCKGIDPKEYAQFLQDVLGAITSDKDGLRSMVPIARVKSLWRRHRQQLEEELSDSKRKTEEKQTRALWKKAARRASIISSKRQSAHFASNEFGHVLSELPGGIATGATPTPPHSRRPSRTGSARSSEGGEAMQSEGGGGGEAMQRFGKVTGFYAPEPPPATAPSPPPPRLRTRNTTPLPDVHAPVVTPTLAAQVLEKFKVQGSEPVPPDTAEELRSSAGQRPKGLPRLDLLKCALKAKTKDALGVSPRSRSIAKSPKSPSKLSLKSPKGKARGSDTERLPHLPVATKELVMGPGGGGATERTGADLRARRYETRSSAAAPAHTHQTRMITADPLLSSSVGHDGDWVAGFTEARVSRSSIVLHAGELGRAPSRSEKADSVLPPAVMAFRERRQSRILGQAGA